MSLIYVYELSNCIKSAVGQGLSQEKQESWGELERPRHSLVQTSAPASKQFGGQACLYAFLSFLATEPDDLSEIINPGQIVGLHEPIIGEVDPGLVVQHAELL